MVVTVLQALLPFSLFLLADLENRSHVLLLLSAFWVVAAAFMGVFALARQILRGTRAVLKAIELLEDRVAGTGRS